MLTILVVLLVLLMLARCRRGRIAEAGVISRAAALVSCCWSS